MYTWLYLDLGVFVLLILLNLFYSWNGGTPPCLVSTTRSVCGGYVDDEAVSSALAPFDAALSPQTFTLYPVCCMHREPAEVTSKLHIHTCSRNPPLACFLRYLHLCRVR